MRLVRGRTLCSALLGCALAAAATAEDRSFDGFGNNLDNPAWGAIHAPLVRNTTVDYEDAIAAPSGADRPGARAVSVGCGAQQDNVASVAALSNLHTIWGQFLDHDITLTPTGDREAFSVEVPMGDPWFDPASSGTAEIGMMRSVYDPDTGTSADNPRQQMNSITAFIDASMVYGSDGHVAYALRALDGSGKLKTSAGDLLPYNTLGLEMANPMGLPVESLFAAGDVRANENCQLTAMHTLFVREHNRQCDLLAAAHPDWDGEELYQRARKIVGALVQWITYNEYLPALLGPDALPSYAGYDPERNPGIANSFQTVAFRLGHSQVGEIMLRLDEFGSVVPQGHISARDALFAPHRFVEVPVEVWLGSATQTLAQEIDMQVVSSLRNFMFGPPVGGGLDLFSLNLQRARDHGLPDYNRMRMDLGMKPMNSMREITSDASAQVALMETYGDVMEQIDPWVAGLAEDHVNGGAVGELFHQILVEQFTRLRDGDRFWYLNDDALSSAEIAEIESTLLVDVIHRNTNLIDLDDDVFHAPGGLLPPLADLTLDGQVGFADLIMLLSSWGPFGTPGQEPRADINGDGTVGLLDLLYLLSHYS